MISSTSVDSSAPTIFDKVHQRAYVPSVWFTNSNLAGVRTGHSPTPIHERYVEIP